MAAPSAVPELLDAEVSPSLPNDLQAILEVNQVAYNRLAETYKETTQERQENAKSWLTERLPRLSATDHPTALDIGCADGTHSRILSSLGYAVTGVDFSARMIATARELADDPTLHDRPRFLHGEFLSGTYVDERGIDTLFDGARFDLVLATAFVHLFPPEADEDALRKILNHVAPGGSALISTTVEPSNTVGLEAKRSTDGEMVHRWRNRYTYEYFVWLVRGAVREVYDARDGVQPWVVVDRNAPEKRWIDVLVTRPA